MPQNCLAEQEQMEERDGGDAGFGGRALINLTADVGSAGACGGWGGLHTFSACKSAVKKLNAPRTT